MLSLVTRLLRRQQRPAHAKRSPELVREYIRRKDFAAAQALVDGWPGGTPAEQAEAHALRGELLFHQRDDALAQAEFQAALKIDPGQAEAHYGLSLLVPDALVAIGHAQFAVNRAPSEARYLAQLGYLHLQLGNPQSAEPVLTAAVKLDPGSPHVWNNLGLISRVRGNLQGAQACFEKALKADPGHAGAAENFQQVTAELQAKGVAADDRAAVATAHDALINDLERRWTDAPGDVSLATQLVEAYHQADDAHSAAEVLAMARREHPDDPLLQGLEGLSLAKTRRFKEAVPLLQQALLSHPDDLRFVTTLATVYGELEQHTKAMPLIEHARTLEPDSELHELRYLAGLINLCRYDEALPLARSMESRGHQLGSTGLLLIYLGRDEEALAWLAEKLAIQPHDPGLRFQRAQLRLSHLDFEHGWDDYHYRNLGDSNRMRVLPFPIWAGEPLTGKRMIVLAEQGLGDQVMFASCLPDLLALDPDELIVEVIDRIAPTIARTFPQCTIVPTRQGLALDWVKACGPVDCYVSLADLPMHFRRSLAAFPTHTGYLRADPDEAQRWRQRLPTSGRLRIGLSWRGGTEGTRTFVRSIPPALLADLGSALDADWISLQYGKADEEVAELRNHGLAALHHWPEAIQDLDTFAALVSTLDLVITVCNTTVHYAGALGVPVWVLSPRVPEWRYGIHNESLPWYPSSRMFRQAEDGDWVDVLNRVRVALQAGPAAPTASSPREDGPPGQAG